MQQQKQVIRGVKYEKMVNESSETLKLRLSDLTKAFNQFLAELLSLTIVVLVMILLFFPSKLSHNRFEG